MDDWTLERRPFSEGEEGEEARRSGPSPGKRTLTGSVGAPRQVRYPISPGKISLTDQLGEGGELPHRAPLEQAFGRDLSGISAHTGSEAQESAASIGAEAYATGDQVVVPPGAGPGLVAHEVAHVLQQREGVQLKGGIDGGAGDPHERQAEAVGVAVERGESVAHHFPGVGSRRAEAGAVVQRHPNAVVEERIVMIRSSGDGAEAEKPKEPSLEQRRDRMKAGLVLLTERWKPVAGSLLEPVDQPEQPPTTARFRQAAYDLLIDNATDASPMRAVLQGPNREAYAKALAAAESQVPIDKPYLDAIKADIEKIRAGVQLRSIRTRMMAHHSLLSIMGRRALAALPSLGLPLLEAYIAGAAQGHGELEAARDPTLKGGDRKLACERMLAMLRTGAPMVEDTEAEGATSEATAAPKVDPAVQAKVDALRTAIADAVKKAAPAARNGAPRALAPVDLSALIQAIEVAGDQARDIVWADRAVVSQLGMMLDGSQARAAMDKLDPVERLYQECIIARAGDEPELPPGKAPPPIETLREKIKLKANGGVYGALRTWLLARTAKTAAPLRLRLLQHTKLKDDHIDRLPDDNQRIVYRLIMRGTEQPTAEDKVHEAAEKNKPADMVVGLRELASSDPGRLAALESNMEFRAAVQGMTQEVTLPDGQTVRPYHLCLSMWGKEVGAVGDPGTATLSEVDVRKEKLPLDAKDRVTLDTQLFDAALVQLYDETSSKNMMADFEREGMDSRYYRLMMEGKKGDPQKVMDTLVSFDRRAAQDPWRDLLRREGLVFGPELEKRYVQRYQKSLRTWIYENSGPVNRSGANRVLGSEQGSSVGMFNGKVMLAGEVQEPGKMSLHQALREHTHAGRPIYEWASVESRGVASGVGDKNKDKVLEHWKNFQDAVREVSGELDAATGITVRAIDLLRNAYLEHSGHMETRLQQAFKDEPLREIRAKMGLTADVDKVEGGPPPSIAELAEERYGSPARALWASLSLLNEHSAAHWYVAARVFLDLSKILPAIAPGEEEGKAGHDVEERPPRSFAGYYRLHYGVTPEGHAVAVVRAMGKGRAVQPSEAAALLGFAPALLDAPPAAAPEDDSIGEHNRHLIHASFDEKKARANAAEIWRILLEDGRVHLIQTLYGDHNDEEQRLIRIAFRRLSGGFDLQFYLRQMLDERQRAKDQVPKGSGASGQDALDLAQGTWKYEVKVGTEGTEESRGITTKRSISSRAKDSELDQMTSIAMSGELGPAARLKAAIRRDSDDECLRIIDELTTEERRQVLRDGPLLSQLYGQLSQYAYERAFKVLTGQGDLADRLYSRSHGGTWGERTVWGGTDETGMREDIRRYLRSLRLQHGRDVRGEAGAMVKQGDRAPDREVIDKEIDRRVSADCLKIASDPHVLAIMKSELDKGELAEMQSMILNGGSARDWAVAGGAGKSQIMEEIRGMSPAERKAKLEDPTYMRLLGQRLTDEKDFRDAMNALSHGGGGLSTLDEKSRSGDQAEGSDRDDEKTLEALTSLSQGDVEQLRADPRMQLQLMSALKTEEQRQLAREYMRGPGAQSGPASTEKDDEAERARQEKIRFLVHQSIHRLRIPCRILSSWPELLEQSVEVFKAPLPLPAQHAGESDGEGGPDKDGGKARSKPGKPEADHRALIWKAVAGDVLAFTVHHDGHPGKLTSQSIAGKDMSTIIKNAVLRVADPSDRLIEAKIQTTDERKADKKRAEESAGTLGKIGAVVLDFQAPSSLDHVYKEEDVIQALNSASDEHLIEHWTTFMARPPGKSGPTMKEEYQEYKAAYKEALPAIEAREKRAQAALVEPPATTAPEPVPAAAGGAGGDAAIDAAAKQATPPQWTREGVAAGDQLGDTDPAIAKAELQRREFLEFAINVSAALEEMLRPYMGDDRTLTQPADPNKPRIATTKNKRYNNLVEVVLARVPQLNPNVVAAKLEVAPHDLWMVRSSAREEIANYTLRKEKNLRHRGAQTSERATASAAKENLDTSTYLYYRTFAGASTDGRFTGDEREELQYRGSENDRAREAYKTALETAAMWSSLITGLLVTLVATVLTGGLALGPLSMMAIGGATALLSATAKAAVNKEILGDEFDSKDKAELVAKEVITALVTMGTTYYAQKLISTVSGLGTVARQANAYRQVLGKPPPLWRTFLNEASEEATSEMMSTVVEAGLEATNPEHWIDGHKQGAKEAKAAGMAILASAPERAFTGAITSLVTAGVSRTFKGGKRGKVGADGKFEPDAPEFDAPKSANRRRVNMRENLKAAFGDPEEKFTGAAVEWLMSQKGSIDWDNAPEELLKGLLQEYNEIGTERGVQTASAGSRARKVDRHKAVAAQYLNENENADFEKMNKSASETDPFVNAMDYARIRTEVAVAGLASWEGKNGQLTPAQRDEFIRYVREAKDAETLAARAKEDPLSVEKVRQAAVVGQHVQVGKTVSEDTARQVMRDLADGKLESLKQLGIETPPGFDPTKTEWGLGLRTDEQTGEKEYIFIKGAAGEVDWSGFPDVHPLGHSHPDIVAHRLQKLDPDGGVPVAQLIATEGADRVHFLPSGADLVYVLRHGIPEHTVFTSFQSRGGGRVGNPVPGSNNAGINIVIKNPIEDGSLFGNEKLPVVRAEIEIRSGSELLWSGPIWGANHPDMGSVISHSPPSWMSPRGATPTAPAPGASSPLPADQRTTAVVPGAVDPTAVPVPVHEQPTGRTEAPADPVPVPVHDQPTGRMEAPDPTAAPTAAHDRPTDRIAAVADPAMAAPIPVNRDASAVLEDIPELGHTASLPPETQFGAHQQGRAVLALQRLSDHEYLAFRALIAAQPNPVAQGFLFKALASGNSIPEIQWLADEIAVADDTWMFDNLTLGDPRHVGMGIVQQWSMSCNAAMTLTMRGNYDPVFALRLRQRNMNVGGVDTKDPTDMNMYQADLEREMLESEYGGAWPGMPSKGEARPHADESEVNGRPADDLLNALSNATGLNFQPRILGHPSEALAILDGALTQGIQVPVGVGNDAAPYAHYILAMSRRQNENGLVEYQFRDPGGVTRWVSAADIAAGRMPAPYNLLTAVEVPSVVAAPVAARAPDATGAPGFGMTRKRGTDKDGQPEVSPTDPAAMVDRDPFVRTEKTGTALEGLKDEEASGKVDKAARQQLIADIRRQVPDEAMTEQVTKGHQTVVRLVVSGTKQLNDDVLGTARNDDLISKRNEIFQAVFKANQMELIESDYKSGTITSSLPVKRVAAELDAIVAEIDERMGPVLQSAMADAAAHWEAELERKRGTKEEAEIEKYRDNAKKFRDNPGDIPFGFQFGTAEIKSGGTDFERGLAAKMSATRAALMSRDAKAEVEAKAEAEGRKEQGPRGQTYDDAAFKAFAAEGEKLKQELIKDHKNSITFGDPQQTIELFDGKKEPTLDALRALRKDELVPEKLDESQRETARKFRRYYDHINSFDFDKGFTEGQKEQASERVIRAMDVVNRLASNGQVTEAEVTSLLDKNATGKVQPKDKQPSERVFYDTSRGLENRLILNADIRDMGNDLAIDYSRKQKRVANAKSEDVVARATMSAEDRIVRFKQTAVLRLQERHRDLLGEAIAKAKDQGKGDLVEQLKVEQERGLLFLLGGDEITISLHSALRSHLPEFAARLADPEVANARVAVTRTGKGSQDGGAEAIGSLKHAMDANPSLKVIKQYEKKLRELERGMEEIKDERLQQRALDKIEELGLGRLYVDVEVSGGVENPVIRRFPDGKKVPANLDERIAKVKQWIEDHRG